MGLDEARALLELFDEETHCSGYVTLREQLAIALPDGDVGAVDDLRFVDWLLAHCEPAPFGHGKQTIVDPAVRHALRLSARGRASIVGFDPADVLDEIESWLSPRRHLEARLLDVTVYPEGGKFLRHKDTPRDRELVATLVVVLPIAFEGGAFYVDDGIQRHGYGVRPGPADLCWVAFYPDVDHEVAEVWSGARVSLVYSLRQTERVREDPRWPERRARLGAVADELAEDVESEYPSFIACANLVITDEPQQPQSIDTLRGLDRDLAEVLVERGFTVDVRPHLIDMPTEEDGERPPFPRLSSYSSTYPMQAPIPDATLDALGPSVALERPWGEDYDGDATSLEPYVTGETQLHDWLVRSRARARFLHECRFSPSGYFGNDDWDAYLYVLVALEIRRPEAAVTPAAE